jgi:hypothetical protein
VPPSSQLLIDFQCAKRPEADLSAHDDASGLAPGSSSRVVPSYLRAARQLGLAHLPLNTALEPPSSLVALPVALQAIARSRNRRVSRVRAGGSLSKATASRVVDGAFREETECSPREWVGKSSMEWGQLSARDSARSGGSDDKEEEEEEKEKEEEAREEQMLTSLLQVMTSDDL